MWTWPSVLRRAIRKALREEKGLSKLSGRRDGRGHRVDIQRTVGNPLACRRGGDRTCSQGPWVRFCFLSVLCTVLPSRGIKCDKPGSGCVFNRALPLRNACLGHST